MISVDEAITSRRSIRAFKPDPVAREAVSHILEVASRSPSGTNMQPWHVHVFMEDALKALCDAVLDAFWNEPGEHNGDRLHYLDKNRDPYLARRRKVGWDLYGLLGIGKGEREKTREFHSQNYKFFDAPVGLIFTIDRDMGWMSWLDYGMFIENICLAARGQGLHTCPQAAWASYHDVVEKHLNLPEIQLVNCGMSMGYEDTDAVVNSLETEREPVEEFVTFHGG
ncbi:MAG: Nitroreductase NfnB [Alphaproteobacteria bacterium MarineAlpha4_Bin2]|mgnify:FL=1|nr:MAG: Nitroreductase NfnB [Alphaproteobacteria bacterium MarineAlpha4_Bin2]